MPRYRDPNAPTGRVVFGGEAFVDGVTADITPGPETLRLFESAGITAAGKNTVEKPVEAAEPDQKPKK